MVVASAGKLSPAQEWLLFLQASGHRCKKVAAGAVSKVRLSS